MGFRLFTVLYFYVRSSTYSASDLTVNGGHLDFQMYRGGGRRGLPKVSSSETHARWQPVTQSALSRRSN